jgi:hypothetical protein
VVERAAAEAAAKVTEEASKVVGHVVVTCEGVAALGALTDSLWAALAEVDEPRCKGTFMCESDSKIIVGTSKPARTPQLDVSVPAPVAAISTTLGYSAPPGAPTPCRRFAVSWSVAPAPSWARWWIRVSRSWRPPVFARRRTHGLAWHHTNAEFQVMPNDITPVYDMNDDVSERFGASWCLWRSQIVPKEGRQGEKCEVKIGPMQRHLQASPTVLALHEGVNHACLRDSGCISA